MTLSTVDYHISGRVREDDLQSAERLMAIVAALGNMETDGSLIKAQDAFEEALATVGQRIAKRESHMTEEDYA